MITSVILVLKLIIALGLLNVWVMRFNKPTQYRGGDSNNMREEFDSYGFPGSFMYAIGSFKCVLALLLLCSVLSSFVDVPFLNSIDFNQIELIGLYLLSIIMLGAILVHIKLKDPAMKSLPAVLILAMSSLVIYFS